ncbi:MAG TPA: OmpA family protein [Chitinophagaceae bacterium]|nr:OmpA family protein [Chitinophagaceae bacterium]
MNFNFLDAVKSFFNNDLISKAASYLGESELGIKRALNAIIPVSLAGIINKAQSAPESLYTTAKETFSSGIINNAGDAFRVGGGGVPPMAPSLITNVLGDKFGSIANAVSDSTGLKGSSVSSLFGSIVPLALGLLGKNAVENNQNPGSLASWLGSQKNAILSAIPSGLNLSNLLPGFKSAVNMVTPTMPKKRVGWLVPAIIALAALLLILWLFRKPGKVTAEAVKTDTGTIIDNTVTGVPAATKESLKITLPDGVELDAYRGGIEDRLINFIKDPDAKISKDVWFDFNDLNFKFNTAEILPESRNELDNIIKILKAYPKVKIKIGGYTDKVGDEAANKKLSEARANAVADAIRGAGLVSQVTGAEGYGSDFAKYPADAPEEQRVKDRRVSVSVREK